MQYVFNKFTFFVIAVIIFSIAVTANEIEALVKKTRFIGALQASEWERQRTITYDTQSACQEETGTICALARCDENSADDSCKLVFVKGWRPSSVEIAERYQRLQLLHLTLRTASSTGILYLNPNERSISYATTAVPTSTVPVQKLDENRVFNVLNNLTIYDFGSLARRTKISTSTTELVYIFEVTPYNGTPESITCVAKRCPIEVRDLANDIFQLWEGPLAEISSQPNPYLPLR